MTGRLLVRGLALLVGATLGLYVADALIRGVRVENLGSALAAALLLAVVQVVLYPLVVRLALPLIVLTLGLGSVLLSAGALALVARALPGVEVDGLGSGLLAVIVLTLVTTTVTGFLTLADDEVWGRAMMARSARKARGQEPTTVPGVVFIQIDGLGHDVLKRAVRDGNAPNLAAWLRTGTHRLSRWETDWSSQTGASQAGILLGSNQDMPAFRWFEKETGELMVSNRKSCAAEIERRLSTGTGLLAGDGVSRGNLFTGDAPASVLTLSVVGVRKGRIGAGYQSYFLVPANAIRTLTATLAEIGREVRQARDQRRHDVLPRVHRGGVYPLVRAFTTVISRDVLTSGIIGDMYDGRAVVYADYVGYDEVAHHAGIERHESLDTLRRLDRELGRLVRAADAVPRPYRIVVLSDHGQSQGATFQQRFGESLGDVVNAIVAGPVATPAAGQEWAAPNDDGGEDVGDREEAVVLASGNLGLVSFPAIPGRAQRAQVEERYPGLIGAIACHPGVGFVLVDTDAGPVVLGGAGRLDLTSGVVTGEDPLAPFGPHAREKVLRTHGFPHCADLMVNSVWDQDTDEVAAFEELVGSHGGMGGEQAHPFVLHPVDLPMPASGVLGAGALHQVLRSWLTGLGHSPVDPA